MLFDFVLTNFMPAGNVAYMKTAVHLETFRNHTANRSVDGDINPDWVGGQSCSYSFKLGFRNWWQVDLGDLHVVFNVTIYNRNFNQCKYISANMNIQ